MTVSGIVYPNRFSGAWNGVIAAGKWTNVTVTFSPNAIADFSGTITVNSDKTSGGNTIPVSGKGTAWLPEVLADGQMGVAGDHFGFNMDWMPGRTVVVETSTNLVGTNWIRVATNVLSGTPAYFSDTQWKNSSKRYYRVREP